MRRTRISNGPLHLALSYDEEVGCKGIKPLIDHMKQSGRMPDMAIIGEPTLMQPVVEHKGKIALTCDVTGESGSFILCVEPR